MKEKKEYKIDMKANKELQYIFLAVAIAFGIAYGCVWLVFWILK